MSEWDDGADDGNEEIGPGDPDYDLSEAHSYLWEPEPRRGLLSPLVLALVSVVVIVALVLPGVLFVLRYG